MFRSPVGIAGLVVMAIGWLILFFGVGREVPLSGMVVANFHSMFIALCAIITGGFCMVVGAVEQRGLVRSQSVSTADQMDDEAPSEGGDSAGLLVDPEQLRWQLEVARSRLNGDMGRSSR